MTTRSWIVRTFAMMAVIACLDVAVACLMDPYGLVRDPHGRKLRIFFSERKAKFLLNKRYVPANFDALLIGPSSSENWNPPLAGVTMYNESILGGNVYEEQDIVDQALPKGHFKLAICVLIPTMTSNHMLSDGLDKVSTSEAFGSIHLFVHEAMQVLAAMHHPSSRGSESNGSTPLHAAAEARPDVIQYGPEYYKVDPVGLHSYVQLMQSLRASGTKIVYVVPPMYAPCLQLNQTQLAGYRDMMVHTLPAGPLINFNGPEYAGFRGDEANFVDCFHVNADGAKKIDAMVEQAMPAALAYYK